MSTWQDRAECQYVDPELFFPDAGRKNTYREALSVCAGCPVIIECLLYVFDHETQFHRFGIWGATTPNQRDNMATQNRFLMKSNRR